MDNYDPLDDTTDNYKYGLVKPHESRALTRGPVGLTRASIDDEALGADVAVS